MSIRDISSEEIRNYHRDGYCYIPQLAGEDVVAELLKAADERMANPGQYAEELASEGRFYQEQSMFREVPTFNNFMTNEAMARNAGQAMGATQVWAYFDHLFIYEPETRVDFFWHQDLAYWPVDGKQVCSFWLSLTDCTRASSALQFVKGTGNRENLYKQVDFGEEILDPNATRFEHDAGAEIPPQFDRFPERFELVTWDFSAGDAVLFNALAVHSAGANSSKHMRRVAYSSRWIGDDAVFKIRPGYQDPSLFPDDDDNIQEGESLGRCRKFPLVWAAG